MNVIGITLKQGGNNRILRLSSIATTAEHSVLLAAKQQDLYRLLQFCIGKAFADGIFDARFFFGAEQPPIDAAADGVKQF